MIILQRALHHEYGHALGLSHTPNRSENFMSYFNTSGNSAMSNIAPVISGAQKYWLNDSYTPWYNKIW